MDPRAPYAFGGLVVAASLVLVAAVPRTPENGMFRQDFGPQALASTVVMAPVLREGIERDVVVTTAATSGWGGDWIASLSSNDCKGIASGDRTWCDTNDCRAIASGDRTWCDSNDCRGVASKDRTWCETNLCKGWASADRTWCDTNDCKGVASKDRTWCDSAQCKAIASADRTWCP